MGVRVGAFAVDVVAFRRVLEMPLWEILSALSRMPPGDDLLFDVEDRENDCVYGLAPSGQVVRMGPDWVMSEVAPADLAQVPVLRQSTREFLSAGISLNLKWLLRELPVVAGVTWAKTLTTGHRRWWIRSVLDAAEADALFGAEDLTKLRDMLARVLRVYGTDIASGPARYVNPPPVPATFPVVPADDADEWMAVFDEDASRRLAGLLERVGRGAVEFPAPDGEGDAAGWDRYVRERVAEWVALRDVPFGNVHLVTFIG